MLIICKQYSYGRNELFLLPFIGRFILIADRKHEGKMRPEKKELISDLDLNDIIDDYYDSIWSYTLFLSGHNPDAAEEITQEVFLCLIEKWHVIKKENVGGWLFGVARRKFYEYIKAEKKEKKHLLYYDDPDSPFFSDKNELSKYR